MRLVLALLVASTAYAEPPPELVRIMNEAHKRVIVERPSFKPSTRDNRIKGNWYKSAFTYDNVVPSGTEVWGNCAVFAATTLQLLREAGQPGHLEFCRNGKHVYVQSGAWALDSQNDAPVSMREACR